MSRSQHLICAVNGDLGPNPDRTLAEHDFINAMIRELQKSRRDHPDSDACMTALTEEVGEVAKAMLDEAPGRVWAECLQVASTALRLAVDGDPSLSATRGRRRGRRDAGGSMQ